MIKIKNLTKTYGDSKVFDDFTCSIENNELVAITGKSGSGKSTLLNILGLLDNKYHGILEIDTIDVKLLKYRERKRFIRDNISYLFQNYALIDDESILDNLMLALTYTSQTHQEKILKIENALQTVGVEKCLSTKIHTLSGGEQQRIAFARTIIKPSKIILADEPTGNLDSANKQQIMDLLLHIHSLGKTVVVVTHDQEIANQCKRRINLDE